MQNQIKVNNQGKTKLIDAASNLRYKEKLRQKKNKQAISQFFVILNLKSEEAVNVSTINEIMFLKC